MYTSNSFFFFKDTATTEIYTLSLHDALPISGVSPSSQPERLSGRGLAPLSSWRATFRPSSSNIARSCSGSEPSVGRKRSEEHTSELQSRQYLVCRLLLEKKQTPPSVPPRPTP